LVAASTNIIIAQRLARKICSSCKEEISVPRQALIDAGFSPEDLKTMKCYQGKGCMECNDTGYRGRVALYEVMAITDDMKDGILQGAQAGELKELARKNGMKTLREAGLQKIRDGLTAIPEVMRVTSQT
jgi:type IV pilus assembly protein PilB